MEKEFYISLIIKQLDNKSNFAEDLLLEDWFYENEENRNIYNQIKNNWDTAPTTHQNKILASAWKKVSRHLGFPVPVNKKSFSLTLAMVSTTLFIIMMFTGWWIFLKPEERITYTSLAGQKRIVFLPDQTKVTLNGKSSISFPVNWEKKNFRDVELKGEAFFEVTKDSLRPFLVNVNPLQIKVLGTSFLVKSYNNDDYIETTLIEGKVEIKGEEINGNQLNLILRPNQKAIYKKEKEQLTVSDADTLYKMSWVKGKLIFKNEPVSEVLKALGRQFNLVFRTKNTNVNNYTITADFTGLSAEVSVDLLCKLIEVKHTRSNNEIIFLDQPNR